MEESMLYIIHYRHFLFISIAVFRSLLALGLPLGEFAMGGYYKVFALQITYCKCCKRYYTSRDGSCFCDILTS